METNANPAPRQKPANISDPPKFSGKREDLEAFKNMVNVKLTGYAEQIPFDQHKLAYVCGRLEGNAQAQVQPHITEAGITLANVPALLNILQTAFRDPDPEGTATRELRKLCQHNKEFSTYVAEFMRLSAIVPWDERAKLDHLRARLSQELQHGLVFLEDATTVQELITQVSRLEARQYSVQANSRTTQPWRATTPQTSRTTSASQNPYCIPPAAYRPPSGTIPSHPSFTAGGSVAMDVSGARPRLTQAEKDGSRQRGECYYCGKLGHLAINCPSPSRRPRPLTANAGELNQEEESGNV